MYEEYHYELKGGKKTTNRIKEAELSRYLADEYPHDPVEFVLLEGVGKREMRRSGKRRAIAVWNPDRERTDIKEVNERISDV